MSKTRIIEAVRKLDLASIKKLLDDNPSLLVRRVEAGKMTIDHLK